MARLPAIDATLRTVERIASAPTAPYHEFRAMRAIAGALGEIGITPESDAYGQLHARVRAGDARRSLALVEGCRDDLPRPYARVVLALDWHVRERAVQRIRHSRSFSASSPRRSLELTVPRGRSRSSEISPGVYSSR